MAEIDRRPNRGQRHGSLLLRQGTMVDTLPDPRVVHYDSLSAAWKEKTDRRRHDWIES